MRIAKASNVGNAILFRMVPLRDSGSYNDAVQARLLTVACIRLVSEFL